MNVSARIRRAATAIAVLAGTGLCAGCPSGDNPDNTAGPTAATTTGTNPSAKDNAPPSRVTGTSPAPAIGDATTKPAERGGMDVSESPAPSAGKPQRP